MAKSNEQKRRSLLNELEFIKESLDDTQLKELIETKSKEVLDEASETKENAVSLQPGVLPGQQSLFSTEQGGTRKAMDNPFLPKHIREKLQLESQETLTNLATLEKSLRSKHEMAVERLQRKEKPSNINKQTNVIDPNYIEELIQHHMKQFEKSLRDYLTKLANHNSSDINLSKGKTSGYDKPNE